MKENPPHIPGMCYRIALTGLRLRWQDEINLRHAFGGRIDPQGYDFICNFVKYRDKVISFCDFS